MILIMDDNKPVKKRRPPKPKYGPTASATRQPRRVFYKGEWVGIGGKCVLVEDGNRREFKEASAKDYSDLAARFPLLIQIA